MNDRIGYIYKMKKRSSGQILASNIKKYLDDHTQKDIKARSGIAQATVSRIIKEETSATLETLDRLATVVGVDPWDLICDVDSIGQTNGLGVVDKRLAGLNSEALQAYVFQALALAEEVANNLPRPILNMLETPTRESYKDFERKLEELTKLLKTKEGKQWGK